MGQEPRAEIEGMGPGPPVLRCGRNGKGACEGTAKEVMFWRRKRTTATRSQVNEN